MWLRVAKIADVVRDRLEDQDQARDTVGQTMRKHHRGGSRTVGKRKDARVPAGSRFRIDRQLCPFIHPVTEFRTRTGALGNVDLQRLPDS